MKLFKNATINGQIVDFAVDHGQFVSIGKIEQEGTDLLGMEVIPGLIDIHTHGAMGMDSMDGGDVVEQLSHFYLKNAVTGFYPTTMSATKEQLQQITGKLPVTTGAAALGYHLEGPYINVDYKGAQRGEVIGQANIKDIYSFEHLGLVTLAPEFEGADEVIEQLSIPVCLGHTGCDYETAMHAFFKGACCVTHAFNAMPPLHHRAPSLMGAAFMSGAYIQVICDGLHVHPAVVRMLYQLFGTDRMILISDSMRATGLPDGEYDLGGQTVRVEQGVSRLQSGTIAGSTATLLSCVQKAMEFGIPKADAIAMASKTPATMMGLNKGEIAFGKDADFVVMDEAFRPVAAYVAGEKRL